MAQNRLNKLELTWIGKYDEEKPLEPRILIENPEYSHGEVKTGVLPNGKQWNGNMLIHGDNLLALKSLEQDYAGCVKCIYIDPPYNTGSAFEHYDDNLEHSIWLSLMRERLLILHSLLSKDGSLWVNLDDNEAHYCKVLCDEIFGRNNFLADVIWEKADSPKMDAKGFSSRHDHILVYAKDATQVMLNKLQTEEIPEHYNKRDTDGRPYYLKPLRAMGVDGFREKRPSLYFPIEAPDGTLVYPKNQDGSDSRWRWSKDKVGAEKHRLEWVNGRNGWSLYFRIYLEDSEGTPPETLWKCIDVGSNRTSKKESKDLFGSNIFDTPKPEQLIQRVLLVATQDGDIVLDSFLGSGTTAAVAHKMGRRWIGVELGDHAYTHCAVRLQKVVDGTDQGGISKAQNWKGGGGYKFYELAPSLLNHDKHGNLVINKEYNADMLAAAMAKHEGFTYAPDTEVYWKQGKGAEKDFIFTTTQFFTVEALEQLHEQMGEDESLLICCTSFQSECRNRFPNITLKKIPQMLLGRCEFDHNDYSLNIVSLPEIEEERNEDFYSENEDAENASQDTEQTLFN